MHVHSVTTIAPYAGRLKHPPPQRPCTPVTRCAGRRVGARSASNREEPAFAVERIRERLAPPCELAAPDGPAPMKTPLAHLAAASGE